MVFVLRVIRGVLQKRSTTLVVWVARVVRVVGMVRVVRMVRGGCGCQDG